MRQIDRGKLYDTDKAELVHTFVRDNLLDASDPKITCSLYRTEKGNYFLHQIRHATRGGREEISALRSDQLIETLAGLLGTEEVLKLFPDKIEEA